MPLKIKYLQCNVNYNGKLIALLGALASLWANTIMIIVCLPRNYDLEQIDLIIRSAQVSHLLIVIGTTIAFHNAITENKRNLLKPWLGLKLLEMPLLLTGSILVSVQPYQPTGGLLPIGIIFLLISLYITMCTWNTYKIMPNDEIAFFTFSQTGNVNIQSSVHPNQPSSYDEPPPNYDQFTNEVKA